MDRKLRTRLETAGQEWLVGHAETLGEQGRTRLCKQLASLDLDLVVRVRAGEGLAEAPEGTLGPLPCVAGTARSQNTPEADSGREALRAGRVGFVVLAGGQASRLRYNGPKGEFPIGPHSDRSLFRILIERVMRGGRDAGIMPRLALTTSSTTDAAIRRFFEEHDCFGYPRDLIRFACQGQIPALDEQGLFLLAERDRVFTNPDGHGGALQALETNGLLAEWQEAGIDLVSVCQIDNPLLRVVDPDFIGRVVAGRAPIATKIVVKTEPAERVGVVASIGGRPALVEYSDISDADSERRDEDGQLTYRLGSIAAHAFRLDFLRTELPRSLPLHVAHKEIPCVDGDGEADTRPGTKYERFLFDLFPRADEIVVCEVERAREFAPLKNFEGVHSPTDVRRQMDAEYRRWYAEADKTPPDQTLLELSPLDAVGPGDV